MSIIKRVLWCMLVLPLLVLFLAVLTPLVVAIVLTQPEEVCWTDWREAWDDLNKACKDEWRWLWARWRG